jgi:hypothetical protein
MLFVHEVHSIHGTMQDEFEAHYRDAWAAGVAKDPDTRLLWYFNVAHGSGLSYRVVTVTGIRNWTAWERFARRAQHGDLQEAGHHADTMRYGVHATMLTALPWSPLKDLDLSQIAPQVPRGRVSLYVEDTVTPEGDIAAAAEAAGRAYPEQPPGTPPVTDATATLTAAFRPSLAGGRRRQVVMLQKILDWNRLATLLDSGTPANGAPWSSGHGAVPFADHWETRFLRTAPWSPLD